MLPNNYSQNAYLVHKNEIGIVLGLHTTRIIITDESNRAWVLGWS
jgi:hypothetical protein